MDCSAGKGKSVPLDYESGFAPVDHHFEWAFVIFGGDDESRVPARHLRRRGKATLNRNGERRTGTEDELRQAAGPDCRTAGTIERPAQRNLTELSRCHKTARLLENGVTAGQSKGQNRATSEECAPTRPHRNHQNCCISLWV